MFQLGSIVDVVADDAILLVFFTVGLGAGLGAVRIKGVALGPAAALFVGIAIGAFDESLSSAEGLGLLRELGLVLFTYTVGLASGPTFLSGLRRGGAKAVAVTAALMITLAGMCALVAELFDLTPADRAGLFAGSATNTPSLQAASEAVTTGDPVVAYSLAYPAAVISMLVVATLLLGRHLHLPAKLEPPREPARAERIVNWTVLVTTDTRPALDDLRSQVSRNHVQSRRTRRGGEGGHRRPAGRAGRSAGGHRPGTTRRRVLRTPRRAQRPPPRPRPQHARLPAGARVQPPPCRATNRSARSHVTIRRHGDAAAPGR